MGLARPEISHDPMGASRFHKVLVLTNDMQKIPAALIVLFLLFLGAVVVLAWHGDLIVGALFLVTAFFNWFMLWMLPRAGRSYGPEKASAIALAVLIAVFTVILSLFSASIVLTLVVMIGITLSAIYATWIEPFNLGVTRQKLHTPHWTSPPLRILHIGDIHMEHLSPRERRLNQLVADLKPDLIVFSGDFVNISYTFDQAVENAIRSVISQWYAPLGTYCVPGTYTVEPVERAKAFTAGLTNLRLLLDEWVSIETTCGTVHILGMVTSHLIEQDRATFTRLMQTAPSDGFKLLLTHAPDVAPEADAAGFDLYVCGHTHGGQIRFPLIGALFTGSHLGKRFEMGRYDLQNTVVYTTRGVGLEGLGAPRARFLCRPEIILWEVGT